MEEIKTKLCKFTFDELILVISFNCGDGDGVDEFIELCESNGKQCNKDTIIQNILALIDPNEANKFLLLIDFLLIFCRIKTWLKYEIRDPVSDCCLMEEEYIENFDRIKNIIEENYQQLKKNVDVSISFLADRIFIRILCEGDRRQHYFQALPSHGYILMKRPCSNEVLEIVITALGFETYKLLDDRHDNPCSLSDLYAKHKSVQEKGIRPILDTDRLKELESFRNSLRDSQPGELNDFDFIDKKIPKKMNNLVIKVSNAKLGNAMDFPELKQEIDDDLRFDMRIKVKSKNLRNVLKQCISSGLTTNSVLPEYIREHFSKCPLNEINYEVE